jgi:hypothetical protein
MKSFTVEQESIDVAGAGLEDAGTGESSELECVPNPD